MEADGVTAIKKSYIQTETFELRDMVPTPDSGCLIAANFENVVIKPLSNTSVLTTSVLPFYCEQSRLQYQPRAPAAAARNEVRFKLKTYHYLKVAVTVEPCALEDGAKPIHKKSMINFKIPVMMIDQNMSSSLHLPAYEPETKNASTIIDTEYNLSLIHI